MAMKPVVPSASALRWFAVVVAPTALALGFLWAGGWVSPHRLTQRRVLASLGAVDGARPGFRRNHAKGVCVTGSFEGNGNASPLSAASVFRRGQRTPVTGRFALAGGSPFQADAPSKVRSMALRFMLPDGQEWRTGMNDIPVFPVRTPQEFNDLQLASQPDPATGKPDPTRANAFRAAHPWLKTAAGQIAHRPLSSGFADDTYRSLDSFMFVAENGTKTAVRWAMVPVQGVAPAAGYVEDPNYLFRRLTDDIQSRALRWRLVVTVAGSRDVIDDASQGWAEDDRQIDAGTLTVTTVGSEEGGPCTGITFDPLILPQGIAPSGDPVLSARSAVYMRSFAARSGEKPAAPAVSPVSGAASGDAEGKQS